MDTTYDVRVYKTEVYRGARVSSYRVRWKTAEQDLAAVVPQRSPGRCVPRRASRRGP